MSRRIANTLENFDPVMERTLRKRRHELRQLEGLRTVLVDIDSIIMESATEHNPQNFSHIPNVEVQNPHGDRPLFENIRPRIMGAQSSIRRPPVQANNFKI